MDKFKHFLFCFFVTLFFGWEHGINTGLVIELTQAEQGNASPSLFLKRLGTEDTVKDFISDALGIGAGLVVRNLIWR